MTTINGYAARPSVRAGEVVRLHIATSAPRFRVDFYRWGARPARGACRVARRHCRAGRSTTDWQWPAYEFPSRRSGRSGVYIAVLGTERQSEHPVPGRPGGADSSSSSPPPRSSGRRVLYKIPTFTYHAYNTAGGGSLYSASQVTTRRPGAVSADP